MHGIFHSIVGFCVYGGLVKFRGSVAHTLIGRYSSGQHRFQKINYVTYVQFCYVYVTCVYFVYEKCICRINHI